MTIYIGVDPGGYSGMALYDTDDSTAPETVEVPYADTGTVLWQWLTVARFAGLPVHVACEVYTISSGRIMTPQPEALKGMGVVEFLCQRKGVPLTWQSPGDAKSLTKDADLRALGWYVKTKDGHANDAQRHILRLIASHDPELYGKLIGI